MSQFIQLLKLAAEQPALRVRKNSDGSVSLEGTKKDGIVSSINNAVNTLDDDPGNHKKKALIGLGGAAAAAVIGTGVASKVPKSTVPSGTAPNPAALLAIPVGAYYAANNIDRPKHMMAGGLITAGGIVSAAAGANSATMPALTNAQRAAVAGSVIAPTALGAYGLHELKRAEAIQRERQQAESATNPVDGVDAINVNKEPEDRYPLANVASFKDTAFSKLKKWLSK